MREYITGRALCKAAELTAELYGLKCPSREAVWKMFNMAGVYPQPLISVCDNGMLWVDRYYVAYQIGDGDVHYTYLTRHHIAEECTACKEASKKRGEEITLPTDIRRCFIRVKRILEENNMNYWISEEISEKNAD